MATTWTVVTDPTLDEASEWTAVIELTTLNQEGSEWQVIPSALDPSAAAANSLLNFGGWAAEDFNVIPELVTVAPEFVQADHDEWTIQSEPN